MVELADDGVIVSDKPVTAVKLVPPTDAENVSLLVVDTTWRICPAGRPDTVVSTASARSSISWAPFATGSVDSGYGQE